MYSHIVLSQKEDDPNEDGLLEAWEMKDLDLNADLVILSACDTARGRVSSGEGMIGMTWAMFIAGSAGNDCEPMESRIFEYDRADARVSPADAGLQEALEGRSSPPCEPETAEKHEVQASVILGRFCAGWRWIVIDFAGKTVFPDDPHGPVIG